MAYLLVSVIAEGSVKEIAEGSVKGMEWCAMKGKSSYVGIYRTRGLRPW